MKLLRVLFICVLSVSTLLPSVSGNENDVFSASLSAERTRAAPDTSEDVIRCKVCERAVSHVWHRGSELRAYCRLTKGPGRDERCDFHDIHPWAIDQMVWGVCDALPTTYQAIHESEFDLVLHDDPQHSDELAQRIRASCVRFLHDHHGVERVGETIQRHLQSGESVETILTPLTRETCGHVCDYRAVDAKRAKRQRKRWDPVLPKDDL